MTMPDAAALHSWEFLDPVVLQPAGPITAPFRAAGVNDYRSAARYIGRLPYGRNANLDDPLAVLIESRGTCSTKHAFLRRLAMEQNIAAKLVVGIYEMSDRNTPGICLVLERYGIARLPEAHCYLNYCGKIIDVIRELATVPVEAISHFLHEEEIAPNQIGAYKVDLHRRFLRHWMEQSGAAATHTLDQLWRIREQCIVALSAQDPLSVQVTELVSLEIYGSLGLVIKT